MRLEELELIEENKEKLGIIRSGLKGVSSLFKVVAGSALSEEEQEKNKNTWEGRLFKNHPYISCGIILANLAITVSGFAYAGITLVEYLKDLYAN